MANQNDYSLKKCIVNISSNLKNLLNLHSINILELAKEAEVSYSAVYRLVHGESNPNLETLLKISKTFDITISQLVGDLPILEDQYLMKSIPIINWHETKSFLDTDESNLIITTSYLLMSSKNAISDKCFALPVNSKTEHLFIPGTILIFDKLNKAIEKYDNKFIMISNRDEIPIIKKLYIEGDRIFLQSINPNIQTYELLDYNTVLAYLVQASIEF